MELNRSKNGRRKPDRDGDCKNNYPVTIDIEGWHDPVYRDELELTGQVHGLNYLKFCRGGDLIPPFNP